MTQSVLQSRSETAPARRPGEGELPRRVGCWELVELAAEGSFARIFRARPAETASQRPLAYALKMLGPRWQNDPRAAELLLREAAVGRRVSHANVVAILAASVHSPPQFVVMPWLEGATLETHLAAGRPFDLPEALWLARQVAEGLDALCQAGWLHGDIKPSNVFLSPEKHVTLLDLGFARQTDETGSAIDRCVLGTCSYLAPEWITSALRADIRSDIYSLGVVLFKLFSGRLPFAGRDLAEVATQHLRMAPPNLARLAPRLPSVVVELVHQMIAKEPLRRPQTPRELVERLVTLEIASFSQRRWA
jgi:serine/threonine-protein kinase